MKTRVATAPSAAAHPAPAGVAGARPTAPERNQHQQRSDRRSPHRVPCRVRLVEPGTGVARTVTGETVNISAGGAAFQVGAEVPLGTWVETLVSHAHGAPLFLCGTVVHVRRTMHATYEIGITMADSGPPMSP